MFGLNCTENKKTKFKNIFCLSLLMRQLTISNPRCLSQTWMSVVHVSSRNFSITFECYWNRIWFGDGKIDVDGRLIPSTALSSAEWSPCLWIMLSNVRPMYWGYGFLMNKKILSNRAVLSCLIRLVHRPLYYRTKTFSWKMKTFSLFIWQLCNTNTGWRACQLLKLLLMNTFHQSIIY